MEDDGGQSSPIIEPETWENITLIATDWQSSNMDLMFAFDTNENTNGCVYLGHFNDGVV